VVPNPVHSQKGIRLKQLSFSHKLASILPLNVDMVQMNVDDEEMPKEEASNLKTFVSVREKDDPTVENFKLLLKNIFFALILKQEADFNAVWDAIKTTKLAMEMSSIIELLQKFY